MSPWRAAKALRVLAALFRVGWANQATVRFASGATESRLGHVAFAFYDREEIAHECWPASRAVRDCDRKIFEINAHAKAHTTGNDRSLRDRVSCCYALSLESLRYGGADSIVVPP